MGNYEYMTGMGYSEPQGSCSHSEGNGQVRTFSPDEELTAFEMRCNSIGGNEFCCPGPAPQQTIQPTVVRTNANVRTLQNFVLSNNCSIGPTGADGIWGDNTRAGVNCLAGRIGWASVQQRFPFVSGLMQVPQGQTWGANTAVASSKPTQPTTPDQQIQRAGILPFSLPAPLNEWWFWVAVAGVGGLAWAGYSIYKDKD